MITYLKLSTYLQYLPAYTTPLIQPMDQGMIYVLKMIQHVISETDMDDPMLSFCLIDCCPRGEWSFARVVSGPGLWLLVVLVSGL